MKVALAAVAVTALAVAAPLSAAHASTGVTFRVDTPEFGIRIGTPVRIHAPVPGYAPAPVYLPPVYTPAYVPPRIIYAPPRVVVPAPVIYPFVHRHPHRYVAPYQYKKFKSRHDDRDYDHRYRRDRQRIGN